MSPPTSVQQDNSAVVALRMEDLTSWIIERVGKMPREHRFTIGDRLIETCLDITTLLNEAAFTKEKLPLLQRASKGLFRSQVLVRLAQRHKLLSIDQRTFYAEKSTEIGKMIWGWTKTVRARYKPQISNLADGSTGEPAPSGAAPGTTTTSKTSRPPTATTTHRRT